MYTYKKIEKLFSFSLTVKKQFDILNMKVGEDKVKRSFKVLCLMLIIFMTSGCMKLNVDMSINKDKSMNLSYVVAFANSLMNQSGTDTALDESDLKQAEESGFKVENYSDGSMTGYKFTKGFSNIDNISDEKETIFDLEKLLDGEEAKVFTVKKGLFKNTYSVKMQNNTATEMEDEMDLGSIYGDSSSDYGSSSNIFGDTDLSMLTSSMDLTFTVNLPNKPINSNATTTENEGKKLEWNLMDQNLQNIEFEFELYNMDNIYLTVGIIGVLVIIIIVIIIMNKKKPNSKEVTPVLVNDTVIEPNIPNEMPVETINKEEPVNNQNIQGNADIQSTINNTPSNQANVDIQTISNLDEDNTNKESIQTNTENNVNTEDIQANVENNMNTQTIPSLNEDNSNSNEIETLEETKETPNQTVTQDIFNTSPENK